ncbi:hypothetical protein [Stutzerimonas kunmingensis]|uniref:hypothetical protein n=1 Tax=Stutzerimonas kunmingensis TaxID=1211807 RepID=UPI001C6160F0|nr:hypothetical protein [Stutzerimonas kunmingensis]
MFLGLRAEAQTIDDFQHFAQVVAALDAVLQLAEYLADLVLDGVRPFGLLLEAMQVGKQLGIDEILEVIAGQGAVVVDLAIRCLGRRPALPTVFRVEDVEVVLALKLGFQGFFLLQRIEILTWQINRAY